MNIVLDPISAFGEKLVVAAVPVAFSTDEGEFMDLDIRGMNDKTILFKNTGGANSMDYQILASVDPVDSPADAEYDIVHKGSTAVANGAQALEEFPNYYNYIRIQLRSASGTSAVIKAAGTGN